MPSVSYTLLIDNAPADTDLMEAIQQVEVEEHCCRSNMLRLKIRVGARTGGAGWNVVDDDLFTRLTPITLLVTVGTSLPVPLINAYVIETSVTYSNDPGGTVLQVVGMDSTVLMNLDEKIRAWPNMADSDIAALLFSEYGLLPVADRTQPVRQQLDVTTIQRGTDIQFLRHLARRNGYECYVVTNPLTYLPEGHFHAPRVDDSPQDTLTVAMGEATNVDSFQARFDMIQPAEAQAYGVAAGSVSDQSAEVGSLSHSELGSSSLLNGGQRRRQIVSQSGVTETAELQSYAQALVDQSAWAIQGQGELNTVAYGTLLRTNQTVLVRGLGTQFSGTYYVERVQHLIASDSYTQHFGLRRNALGLTGLEPFTLG